MCIREAPAVAEVQARYGDDITFIGVAGRDDVESMRAFIDERGVSGFAHIGDETGEIWNTFGVVGQPAYVFISDDGSTETLRSGLGLDELTRRAEALLA